MLGDLQNLVFMPLAVRCQCHRTTNRGPGGGPTCRRGRLKQGQLGADPWGGTGGGGWGGAGCGGTRQGGGDKGGAVVREGYCRNIPSGSHQRETDTNVDAARAAASEERQQQLREDDTGGRHGGDEARERRQSSDEGCMRTGGHAPGHEWASRVPVSFISSRAGWNGVRTPALQYGGSS
jgi:hypothetical protein